MKFVVSLLSIILQLTDSTVGRCQLKATVRTTEDDQCSGHTGCSRSFNLYEITESDGTNTDPKKEEPTPTPTNVSCISNVTTTTTSITRQGSCNRTSRPTTTITQKLQTTVTLISTITTWTPCPQNTVELVIPTVTQKISQNKDVTSITKTVSSQVHLSCTPRQIQPVIQPDKTTFSTASPVLEAGPCNTYVQGAGLFNVISTLGALLGISLVLLALVTIGWVWTCWSVRKRGGITINSKQNNFLNTPGTVTINNNIDTLRRLQNPLYEESTTNGLLPLSEAELQTGQVESEETGPTYEIIPLADPVNSKASNKNGNARLEKQETPTASGCVSVEMDSSKNDDTTQNNIGSIGENDVNHYYLPDEKAKGESSKKIVDRDRENNYHLLGNAEEEREKGVRENVYHVLENPLDSYDEDYADPDEEKMNNIYHVLEGPTPEREEEKREKDEREEESEKVEREEPLTEPMAYEIPLASASKHNSTVLQ